MITERERKVRVVSSTQYFISSLVGKKKKKKFYIPLVQNGQINQQKSNLFSLRLSGRKQLEEYLLVCPSVLLSLSTTRMNPCGREVDQEPACWPSLSGLSAYLSVCARRSCSLVLLETPPTPHSPLLQHWPPSLIAGALSLSPRSLCFINKVL